MTINQKLPIVTLPTTEKAALYIRQAAASQTRMSSDLRQLNTELLVKFAHKLGWTDENLIIFNDSGIPATAPLEKREGMRELLTTIEREEVKAVLLYSEYSLTRDTSLVDISFFVELCRRHGVFVVTPDGSYDFTNPAHVRMFLFALEAAHIAIYARTNNRRKRNTSA